ncbi:hypothetical protein AB4068_11340 [Arthrobacter sp. 2RAF22]|uniref:hypothetical protein n=1 Tax=Arthrobacter sp. 2RAF22 TaxID=3232996 RepID=UPI003F8FC261
MTEPLDVRHLSNAPRLTEAQAYAAALDWYARLSLPKLVIDYEESRTGPKRKVPFKALLVGAAFHMLNRNPSSLHMSAIAQEIELLSRQRKKELGIRGAATAKNLWETKSSLLRLLTKFTMDEEPWTDQGTGEILDDARIDRSLLSSFDVFLNWMIAASVPPDHPLPAGTAIDGTGVEAYALPDRADHGQAPGRAAKPAKRRKGDLPDEPQTPGRRRSVDPDARWGKKTATDNNPKEMYFGYEAHFGVDANPKGAVDAPRVLRSFIIVPASTNRARAALAGLDIVKKVAGEGYRLSRVYVDRGYSMLTAENWQLPLWSRNLCPVFDLAQNQMTTRPSRHSGTIFIDGALFTDALPMKLREKLLSPTEKGISKDESDQRARMYDERSHYAYRPHGARDPETGRQRFKGPANAGKLKCPNNPESMRFVDDDYPETLCDSDTKCGCTGTVTLGPEDHARESQWPLFRTTAWLKLYGARNAVESFNADVRTNKLNWRRGYVKTFNRTRTAFLLAITLVALNYWIVRDWAFNRRLQNPWGGEHWDYGPEPKKTRARRTKLITDHPAS